MSGHEFIVDRRKALGITQRDLARMIKRTDGDGSISPQLMNCIEHGRRSYKPYVKDLAQALEVNEIVLWFYLGEIPEKYRQFSGVLDLTLIPKAYYAFWDELQEPVE